MLVDLPEKLICISVLFTELTDNPDTLGRLIEESALFDTAADFEPFTALSFSEALLRELTLMPLFPEPLMLFEFTLTELL